MAWWGEHVFKGERPRLDDRQLPIGAAAVARDCWLSGFRPSPIPDVPPPALADVGLFSAGVKTIYPYDQPAGGPIRWIGWDNDVDVVRAPVRDDVENRILWTGYGAPKQINSAILQAGGGLAGNPASGEGLPARALGVEAPDQAPTVAAGALSDADSDRIAVYDSYVYTFVTDLGEEGPPSPPSTVVQRGFNNDGSIQPVTVSNIAVAPTGTGFYSSKRLYRTAVGTGLTSYQFLAEIPIAQVTYQDSTLPANLGSGLVSQDWDPPDAELRGLIALPNGSCAAFKGRELHLSEPYQPHAWPATYVHVLEEEIVGLGSYGTTIVIGTTGSPYLAAGSAPAFVTVAKMEFDQSCVSKRSFSRVSVQGVAYASPDGIVLVGPRGGELITRQAWDRKTWAALGPKDVHGTYHDDAYVGFLVRPPPPGGVASQERQTGFAFSQEFEGAVSLSDDVLVAYRDRQRDTIYVVDRGTRRVREWRAAGDGVARTMRWRSRLHTGRFRTFSAAQVVAEGYPIRFRILADGAEVLNRIVDSDQPFRLPCLALAANWQYEVEGVHEVEEVRIGTMWDMI